MQVVQAVMRILRAGLPYFLLLIGVGFALGILRLLLITPHDTYGLDDHIPAANLLQAPAMFLVTLVAARKIAASSSLPASPANLRRVGFISLVCVVTAEFSVVLWFQGHPITRYFVGQSGVAEIVYTLTRASRNQTGKLDRFQIGLKCA